MRACIRLALLASATALVVVTAMGSVAYAGRLEWSANNFRIVWTGFNWHLGAFELGITCPLTVEGTWHTRTFAKTAELLIGHVTRAAAGGVAECMGAGSMTAEVMPPWNVRYNGFTGRLPAISAILVRIVEMRFTIANGAVTCRLTTTAARPFKGQFNINGAGEALTFTPDSTAGITLEGANPNCALQEGIPLNNGNVTLLNALTKLRVRLI